MLKINRERRKKWEKLAFWALKNHRSVAVRGARAGCAPPRSVSAANYIFNICLVVYIFCTENTCTMWFDGRGGVKKKYNISLQIHQDFLEHAQKINPWTRFVQRQDRVGQSVFGRIFWSMRRKSTHEIVSCRDRIELVNLFVTISQNKIINNNKCKTRHFNKRIN